MTILSSDHARIMVGLSSNRLSIGGSNSGIFRWHLELRISWQAQYLVMLDGNQRCSAHCKWRFNTFHIVRSYYHDSDFAWQARCLVQMEGDSCCSAHCKWRFISDADHSWDSFCVAGAVFGEGGVSLFVAGAARREILIAGAGNVVFFHTKLVSKTRRVRSPKRRVRDFVVGSCSDHGRIILESSFYWRKRKQFRDFPLTSWTQNFMAGAVFGEVGLWLLLLRAL